MRIPLSRARSIAEHIVGELDGFCERIEIAGSVRRERDDCGDIDIVLQPEDEAARKSIEKRVRERCTIQKNGPELLVAIMPGGTQIDLWFARGELKKGDLFAEKIMPSNFGSVLLCRTGSIQHNIVLVEHAKARGLRWHPHDGLMRGNEVIVADTEEEIFDRLGLRFIPPTKREGADFSYSRWMKTK